MYSAEQVVNGIINYADSEVIGKLPTSGKWIMGTAIGLASTRINNIIETLMCNSIVTMLGIVDDDGNIDIDSLAHAVKSSADKYGKLSVDVPLIGRITFSSADVEQLRSYITRCNDVTIE